MYIYRKNHARGWEVFCCCFKKFLKDKEKTNNGVTIMQPKKEKEMPSSLLSNDKLADSISRTEKSIENEESILFPETIKSEVNFLIFPFFALWSKDVKKKIKTEYKTLIKRGTEKLEISWRVSSNPEYGYPGPFDREVYKAIEQIISELPLPIKNPIPLGSLHNLYKRIAIKKPGGSQYTKIKEALERIIATTIKSKGAFYSKEKEEWIEDVFHLYDRVIFKGKKMPSGEIADNNYLYLNSWYLDNINARYVKPINWNYYRSLETPITQRLYELLSVKFYRIIIGGGKSISYKYSTICDLLPITRQEYLSSARRILDPAHEKLEKVDFLEGWKWEELLSKGEEKDWLISYYPGKKAKEEISAFKIGEQLELELPTIRMTEDEFESELSLSNAESDMVENLILRGISEYTAKKLVKSYPSEQIQRQIKVFDWLKLRKNPLLKNNPVGFLRKSIEENYQPPQEYLDQREGETKEQKKQDRKVHWLEHREKMIKRDIANWNKTSPEERVKGMLDFWVMQQKLSGLEPTSKQIQEKMQQFIDGLPKSEQEKREYLANQYPENPAEDFE